MAKPFVSLVINNYNYAEFLGACIRSCIKQATEVPYEVIVVDDGSTDHSMQVINSFGSSVKVVVQRNGGQAAAFSSGWRAASGEVVWFVDSDDLLLPHAVDLLAEEWIPGSSFAQGGLRLIDREGVAVGLLHSNEWLEAGDVWSRILTRTNHSFVYSPTTGIAFSRDVLSQCLPMREDLWRTSADGMLVHLAAAHGPVLRINDLVAEYRLHGSNAWADVQFSANRDQGSEWGRRLRLHELLRLCSLVEMICVERSRRWDFTFGLDMYARAVELHASLEPEFWSTSRISKPRVEEALREASLAVSAALDEREVRSHPKRTSMVRAARSGKFPGGSRALAGAAPESTATLARASNHRAGDLQALRHLPVWDVVHSPAIRRPDRWPHGAAWSRGFSRHAWNPIQTVPYNLAPTLQLRVRVPNNNAALLFLLVGANVNPGSRLRVEVACNGSRLPAVDFTGLTRLCIPTAGNDCIVLDLKLSVNDNGTWRHAAQQEFYLVEYAVLPSGNSGSLSIPLRPEYQVADLQRPAVAAAWAQYSSLRGVPAAVGSRSLLVNGNRFPVRLTATSTIEGGEVVLQGVRCAEDPCPTSKSETRSVASLPQRWIGETEVWVPLGSCGCIKSIDSVLLVAAAEELHFAGHAQTQSAESAGSAIDDAAIIALKAISEWPSHSSDSDDAGVEWIESAVLSDRLVREWLWRADLQSTFDVATLAGRRELLCWSQTQGMKERPAGTFDLENDDLGVLRESLFARHAFDQFLMRVGAQRRYGLEDQARALATERDGDDQIGRRRRYRNAWIWAARSDLQDAYPASSRKWMEQMNGWWERYGRLETLGDAAR